MKRCQHDLGSYMITIRGDGKTIQIVVVTRRNDIHVACFINGKKEYDEKVVDLHRTSDKLARYTLMQFARISEKTDPVELVPLHIRDERALPWRDSKKLYDIVPASSDFKKWLAVNEVHAVRFDSLEKFYLGALRLYNIVHPNVANNPVAAEAEEAYRIMRDNFKFGWHSTDPEHNATVNHVAGKNKFKAGDKRESFGKRMVRQAGRYARKALSRTDEYIHGALHGAATIAATPFQT
jgi:hypothetical protein